MLPCSLVRTTDEVDQQLSYFSVFQSFLRSPRHEQRGAITTLNILTSGKDIYVDSSI